MSRAWHWANGFALVFSLARFLGGWYASEPEFTGSLRQVALAAVAGAIYGCWSLSFVAVRRAGGVTPLALLPFTLGWCVGTGVVFLVACPVPCVEGRSGDVTAIGSLVLGLAASYANVHAAAQRLRRSAR